MNIIYNELLYYRIFITYYSTYNQDSIPSKSINTQQFKQELIRTEQASDLALRMLKEMYFSYPIHL
ncbi:MAG: hypothetical protein GXP45_00695 [bacterium]|nr:hypothetical protein [bacterium]